MISAGWFWAKPQPEKWWSDSESQVGMMKFPTEWTVIKAMFQTTNQWFLGCFLEDALIFLMLTPCCCWDYLWKNGSVRKYATFRTPKVNSWSSFSSFPIPKLQVWRFLDKPILSIFCGGCWCTTSLGTLKFGWGEVAILLMIFVDEFLLALLGNVLHMVNLGPTF